MEYVPCTFEKQYSVKEAAAILGVSPDTVRRLIRKGCLKAWKLPRSENRRKRCFEVWRVSELELRRFMRMNENAA